VSELNRLLQRLIEADVEFVIVGGCGRTILERSRR